MRKWPNLQLQEEGRGSKVPCCPGPQPSEQVLSSPPAEGQLPRQPLQIYLLPPILNCRLCPDLSFPLPSFLLLSLHRVSLLPPSPALDATCIGTQSLLLSQGLSLHRCFTQPSTLEPELVSMPYDPDSQLVKTTLRRQCQQPSNRPGSLTTVPQPLTPPVLLPGPKPWMS